MDNKFLLKLVSEQLAANKLCAVSHEKVAAAIKADPQFQSLTAPDAAGAFGADTDKIARSAAPVLAQFRDALFSREPLRADDLVDAEAAYAAAIEARKAAEQNLEDANLVVAYARGLLGTRTRTAVDVLTAQRTSRTTDPELQARFSVESRSTFSIIEERRGTVTARRNKGADLRAEVTDAKEQIAALQAENESLRAGIEAPHPPATMSAPVAPRRARRARR